jgi:UDP-glucose 4-epimerase
MKNLFITGGAGFIGTHLCRYLLETGYNIVVFDDFSSSSMENFSREFAGSVEIIKGDIREKKLLEISVEKTNPDVLIHLAARVSVQDSMDNPELTYDVNIRGTQNVVEAGKTVNLEKFIFTSSAAVYGEQDPPLGEDKVILNNGEYKNSLLSPYAVSKLKGEEIVLEGPTKGIIFRMFNVYGPGQKKSGGYAAVIPEFIEKIQKGESLEIHGDGSQTRDFIYMGDVIRAFRMAIESDTAKGVYNLASGEKTSILELVSTLEKGYDRKVDMNFKPQRDGDIKKSSADISKIQNELGFRPEIDLEEGIKTLLY